MKTHEIWSEEAQEVVEVKLPSKNILCDRCRGNGTHTNPNIDGNGLSDEYQQDPEFMESYCAGHYDVPCEVCKGLRVP